MVGQKHGMQWWRVRAAVPLTYPDAAARRLADSAPAAVRRLAGACRRPCPCWSQGTVSPAAAAGTAITAISRAAAARDRELPACSRSRNPYAIHWTTFAAFSPSKGSGHSQDSRSVARLWVGRRIRRACGGRPRSAFHAAASASLCYEQHHVCSGSCARTHGINHESNSKQTAQKGKRFRANVENTPDTPDTPGRSRDERCKTSWGATCVCRKKKIRRTTNGPGRTGGDCDGEPAEHLSLFWESAVAQVRTRLQFTRATESRRDAGRGCPSRGGPSQLVTDRVQVLALQVVAAQANSGLTVSKSWLAKSWLSKPSRD